MPRSGYVEEGDPTLVEPLRSEHHLGVIVLLGPVVTDQDEVWLDALDRGLRVLSTRVGHHLVDIPAGLQHIPAFLVSAHRSTTLELLDELIGIQRDYDRSVSPRDLSAYPQ